MLFLVCSIVYVIASFFLIFVVLIQKGEGGGLGGAFGGGAVDTAFGAKADKTWKRATSLAAALFFILAVVLGILQNHQRRGSLTDASQEADAAESATDGGGTGVSETLGQPGMQGSEGDDTGVLEDTGDAGEGEGDASDDEAPQEDGGE